MRITKIDCTPFTLPMAKPITFAAGHLASTQHVLFEVHTDQGLIGRAESPSRPFFYGESQLSMIAAVKDWFGPAIIGSDPFNIERAWHQFDNVEHNNTVKGALDMALHDIMGQALGLPCYRMLGGYDTSARVTYVCGYASPDEMAEEALAMHEKYGITAFKLKVGKFPVQDEKMIRAVRAAVPDSLLYLDGNEGFRAQDAIRVLRVAEEYGVAWVEEPCEMHDRAGRIHVARAANVPILGDESCRTLEEVAREIEDCTIHMVSIKTARTGYRLSRNIVAACAAARVRPMVGSQGDSGVGVLTGLHFCVAHRATQSLPAELSFFLNLAGDVLAEPIKITKGYITVPERPGNGVVIDPDKLKHYRVEL